MRFGKIKLVMFSLLTMLMVTACGSLDNGALENEKSHKHLIVNDYSGDALKIASGSENAIFNDIIENYAKTNKKNIQIDYLGSLDQMEILADANTEYDAVWPASSMWIQMADKANPIKYDEVTNISPVVFGIKESKAKELGFYGKEDVSTKDIAKAIAEDKLKFTMTSATQSNSGASAYLGFLTALNNEEVLDRTALDDDSLKGQMKDLLSGVSRSSGSSNFLVELFLNGNYDAMVNYEQLIIQTNKQLREEGREELYMIYPSDGLSISDSTLAYIDKGNEQKEEDFLDFEDFLLSDETQNLIEQTGKRNKNGGIAESNKGVFKEYGANPDIVLNTIRMPKPDDIRYALNLYQSELRKPSYTVYVLDFSGSMDGEGHEQLMNGLSEVMLYDNANKNLLLGTSDDVTYTIPYSTNVFPAKKALGNKGELEETFNEMKRLTPDGWTYTYEALSDALDVVNNDKNLDEYSVSIVLLTDGEVNGKLDFYDFQKKYESINKDIPVYSILFGDASSEELERIADETNAKVFDGRDNLIGAFKSVKGYN